MDVREYRLSVSAIQVAARLNLLADAKALDCLLHYDATDQLMVGQFNTFC